MGKSTLALNIANHLSNTKNVLFFSLEMSQVQLMMKMVSCDSNIPLSKVEKNQLEDDENQIFYQSLAKASNKNMNIILTGLLMRFRDKRHDCSDSSHFITGLYPEESQQLNNSNVV